MVVLLLIIPILATLILAVTGARRISAYLNMACSFITFCVAIIAGVHSFIHPSLPVANQYHWFYLDSLSIFLLILTTFISFTTSWFSISFLQEDIVQRKLSRRSLRFYHSFYQFFIFTLLLALVSNNLGILWVAMEGATLSTALLVSSYRTPASIEASWKYLILCGVGIAQALLGTILLYFAAEKILGSNSALLWTQLQAISNQLSPHIVILSFIFVLVGYGTKLGLVPLHNWLPDAYGEAPAPVTALLSGLLLNVAMYAILRFKSIVDGATQSHITDHLLLGFGLLNILVAAFFLLRQKEVKRLFAYSSIEHMGIISFAFGLNTTLATIAAFLHMVVHALSKTALFFSAGQAIQRRQTQVIVHIKGLIQDAPLLGWGFFLAGLAILGIPPFGTFTSEFLIIVMTAQHQPWLLPLLFIGLIISFATILIKMQNMTFGETQQPIKTNIHGLMPVYLHLVLVAILSVTIPIYLWICFVRADLVIH